MIEALGSLASGVGEAVGAVGEVVAAIPAVSGEVGSAVSAVPSAIAAPVSLGGEVSVATSIVAPEVETSGGALASSLDSTSIFTETVPFSASAASVPEMPIGKSVDILNNPDFVSMTPSVVSVPEMSLGRPTDVLEDPAFVPMEPSVAPVFEKPLANPKGIFSDSWTKLGEISEPTAAEIATPQAIDVFESTEAVSPVSEITSVLEDSIVDFLTPNEVPASELPAKVSVSGDEWLSLLEESQVLELVQEPVPVEPQIIAAEGISDLQAKGLETIIESPIVDDNVQVLAEETVAQNQLAEKVVQLLVEEGVYTEPQARIRVGEIALESKGLSEDIVRKVAITVQAEAKPQTAPVLEVSAVQAKTTVGTVETKTHENKPAHQQEDPKRKSSGRGIVVDEKAQANRRKTIGENILILFQKARHLGLKKVNSWEITENLEKKQANKSYLLTQLDIPHVADGSLEEAARSIESLGEFESSSDSDGRELMSQIDGILAKNIPVEIANPNTKAVSEEDVKKVLKHAGERMSSV